MVKRAKWYVDFIRKEPNEQTMLKVARLLIDECSELMKARTKKTNVAAIAILDAQDQKWRLICQRLPEFKLRTNGFRIMVLATFSNLIPYLAHWKEAQTKGE